MSESINNEAIRAAAQAVGEYLQAPPSMWDTIERLIQQRIAPKSPSETYYGHPRLDTGLDYAPAGFLASEAKNISSSPQTLRTDSPAPAFTSEWDTAPRSMTRTTERECAEYWFERGKLAGRMAEMVKIAQRNK